MKKKLFLLGVFYFVFACALAQQQNIFIERSGGRLAITPFNSNTNPVILTDEQLQELFSDEQYSAYKIAHKYYIASIPLWAIAGTGITISTAFVAVRIFGEGIPWLYYNDKSPEVHTGLILYIIGAVGMGMTLTALIPGITLMVHGTKALDKIANNYNLQQKLTYQREIKLKLGLVGNGIGFTLIF